MVQESIITTVGDPSSPSEPAAFAASSAQPPSSETAETGSSGSSNTKSNAPSGSDAPALPNEAAPAAQTSEGGAPAASTEAEASSGEAEASDNAEDSDGAEAPEGDNVVPDGGEKGAAGEKKRRRRRRGKKGGGAADAAGQGGNAPSAAGEGSETATADAGGKPATGEAKSGKDGHGKRKREKKEGASQPPRERSAFHVGEEVFGRVTSVTADAIMVDLSGKALAIFDRHELAADDLVPEVGDRFVAHIHNDGSRGGLVVLTRKPLREEETKPRVEAAAESGQTVQGLVTGTIKGGLEVDVDGLRAFAPASHVDLHPGADLAHLIGRRMEFTIAQYAKRGRDVVVSRKSFLEAEAREQRKTALAKLEAGAIVKGIVRSVVQYGAFIAIPTTDDVEGLVHMTEARHDRNARLSSIFKIGAEIDVKILRVDDKGKLWLSHKATIPDPWEEAMKTFAPGTRHNGKVMRLQPFGAFIELATGVEGLMHTSDMSFKRIEHPNEVLKEGQDIEVVVAEFDRSSHKIALHPAPPAGEENEPRQKVVASRAVKVAVVSAEHSGLVVRVLGLTGRHARGFIPAGHTGTERGTDLRRHFPVGTKLDAKVIEIDPRRGEAKLSLRALKEDTEKAAYNEYRASVAKASKFGTLGDLLAKRK